MSSAPSKLYDKDSDINSPHMNTPSRRTARNRQKPIKYNDYLEQSPSKQKPRKVSSSEEEEFVDDSCQQKPTALFSDDDVEGQDIFKFKSRHTKQDLQEVVKLAHVRSPRVVLTPLKTPKKQSILNSPMSKVAGTPRQVREVIKKRIIQEVESDSSGDYSGSNSDYVPDGSENDEKSESSSSEASSSSEDEEPQRKVPVKSQITKTRSSRNKCKDSEYIVKPDDYFMMNSSKKIATSDHTLSRLKNMNIQDNSSDTAHISKEHRKKIAELNHNHQQLFDRWLYELSEHFSIILYGIGSKRTLLQQFQKEKLSEFPCIVINGFFPSLTIKSILETIVLDLLENTTAPSNIGSFVALIDSQLSESGTDLFLIINNIDGPMLRNAKSQAALASLSQIKNVHTIATIDHINAPLLWDYSKLSKYNFSWWDVTSFVPYTEETSYENSIMTQKSGALQLSSLRSVYQSLTSNSKGIFTILIENQLENQKQPHYQGLPFKDLYSKCREQFLVSSDLALRAQLTEFLDHKLVKMKRTFDGSENLVIPIDNVLLQQFLEQQNS